MLHLVTGGSGFLGNLIAQRLISEGQQVIAADVWEDPRRDPRIQYVQCDVRDRAAVEAAMKGVDIVHHNAALVPLTKSHDGFLDVNIEGSRIVAKAAARAKVRRFIHMSSSAIYGCPNEVPIRLSTPADPIEAYGRSKLAGEMAVREVARKAGMPLIVIRPRTILGPGRLGIFQILFEWIHANVNVYVIGSGNVPFQFVHAHDLMDAYMLAAAKGQDGIYNVGTPHYGTLRQALETLIGAVGSASKVRSLPERLTINTLQTLDKMHLSPLAPWHYLTYHKPFAFDVGHVLDLGWQPRYSNDQMLLECYRLFLEGGYAEEDAASSFSPHRKKVKQSMLRLLKLVS
jgi:nucleoside-diphosphate-sugar epimerase